MVLGQRLIWKNPSDGMLILSVGSIIAVLFFVTYAAQQHDLNGIKDKTVGNGQHGTARWATRQEVKQTYHHVPYTPNQWRQAAKEGKQPTANGIIRSFKICSLSMG